MSTVEGRKARVTQLINEKDFFSPAYGKDNNTVPLPGMTTLIQCGWARAHVDLIRKSVGFSCSGEKKRKKKGQMLNTAEKSTCGTITSFQRSVLAKMRKTLWSHCLSKVVRCNLVTQ